MSGDTYNKSSRLVIAHEDLEQAKFVKDIDENIGVRYLVGKQLENLFGMVNSDGFLSGEIYDGCLVVDNFISEFKTFHFFFEGEEKFQITLGFNSSKEIGLVKLPIGANITAINYVQGLKLGNEPAGTLLGILVAFGGTNVIFSILQDLTGFFELQNKNQVVSTVPVPEGEYTLIIKAVGQGGTEYVDQITIIISATALISNINLSDVVVEDTAAIGTTVGALSTQGGEAPITYTLLTQNEDDINGVAVDIFEIVGDVLQTKAAVGVAGDIYFIAIKAEDSRVALPDDLRTRVETFSIQVVLNTFTDTNSLTFNGVDEYLTVPNHASLWGNTNFSVSLWVKPTNVGASVYQVSKFGAAGFRSWGIRVNTAGHIAIVYSQTGVASDTTTAPNPVTFGVWSHVVISFDGTLPQPKMKIFINGALDVDEDTALAGLYNNTTIPIYIGAIWADLPAAAASFASGLIDELSIYNTSLTASDVTDLYNLGVPVRVTSLPSASGLVSWWRLGDNFTGSVDPDEILSNDAAGVNMNNSNKSTSVPI